MINTDRITEEGLRLALSSLSDIDIEVHEEIDSTNIIAARRVAEGCREWHTVIALSQTGGQGRLGRSFFSPSGSGLYMSTVLRPRMSGEKSALITGSAAVALSDAIEEVFGISCQIKWVNDIFVGGRKAAGILAKAVYCGGVSPEAVILGIGINVYRPEGGFPADIERTAGYLLDSYESGARERLAAAVLEAFAKRYAVLGEHGCVNEYRRRCLTVGREVTVLPAGADTGRSARAVDIDDEYHLIVEYPDGVREAVSSGEVSVKI